MLKCEAESFGLCERVGAPLSIFFHLPWMPPPEVDVCMCIILISCLPACQQRLVNASFYLLILHARRQVPSGKLPCCIAALKVEIEKWSPYLIISDVKHNKTRQLVTGACYGRFGDTWQKRKSYSCTSIVTYQLVFTLYGKRKRPYATAYFLQRQAFIFSLCSVFKFHHVLVKPLSFITANSCLFICYYLP